METADILEEIERVLDREVRPDLAARGGAVEVVELDQDGTLHVRMMGRCAGCPGADLTAESLIQEAVTEQVPGVARVVLSQHVSGELLAQARKLLAHEL